MSDQELLFATFIVGVALIIFVRFLKFFLTMGILAAGVGVALCAQDGAECKLPNIGDKPPWFPKTEPSEWNAREAAIDAVYTHVDGKTYQDSSPKRIERRIPCSRDEAERDTGGLDPHYGNCRGYGGRGYGYKVEVSYTRNTVSKACLPPPSRSSSVWRVNTLEPRRWLVSNPKGRWVVLLNGSGHHVEAHQPC